MNRLLRVVVLILENLTPLATAAYGIVVALKANFADVSTADLLTWTLTLVALLATTELVSRSTTLRRLQAQVDHVHDFLETRGTAGNPPAYEFFVPFDALPALSVATDSATDICICGTSLMRSSTTLRGEFERLLRRGVRLKFLLIDPAGSAIDVVADRNYEAQYSSQTFQFQLRASLASLVNLRQIAASEGLLEVRVLDTVPSIGLMYVRRTDESEVVYVQVFPYRRSHGERPWFVVNNVTDNIWTRYFVDQFNSMWRDARPYEDE